MPILGGLTMLDDSKIPNNLPLCTKRAFVTKDDARREMKRIRDRIAGKHKAPQRSYECPICGYWHLTSKPDKRFL